MTKQKLIKEAENFKIRCSQIGIIMTNPRTKKDKEAGNLSETTKSYCKMWLKQKMYNRKYEFSSKYTEKGNAVEQESIDYAAENLGWGMVFKNEDYRENEYLTGTCDVVLPNKIVDMKNSYDWATFPIFETTPPDKNNEQQLQGYMELWGKEEAQIVYTLMDLPADLLERELSYKTNEKTTQEEYESIIKNYEYSDLPADLRIKEFAVIKKNDEYIEAVKLRVLQCRKFLLTLIK